MQVDNDIAKLQNIQDENETGARAKTEKGSIDKDAVVNTLNVKYCLPEQVNKNR